MEDKTQHTSRLFFSGIAGSGMMPLALIALGRRFVCAGSDRSFDQGRYLDKKALLESKGITLAAQDGSGLKAGDTLVISTAVEADTPDVTAAKALGCVIKKRADVLAEFVNAAPQAVAVAGTSGKSTTTGMLAYITQQAGLEPTVMNGAVMKNFDSAALVGGTNLFVSECDESDGSISLYRPTIGVVNNIALDHKDMDTLQALFSGFVSACRYNVLNADCARTKALATETSLLHGIENSAAQLNAQNIRHTAMGSVCTLNFKNQTAELRLNVPGKHNVSNALAAIAAATLLGVDFAEAVAFMAGFTGMKRRLEVVGTARNITVIDDFAHNPDKIAASLNTLHLFEGRLLVLFQMHGFGAIKLLKDELVTVFKTKLNAHDKLYLPEALYFGGTVAKDVTMHHIAQALGAPYFENRDAALPQLLQDAQAGDRIVIMGARDDGLTLFAQNLVHKLGA